MNPKLHRAVSVLQWTDIVLEAPALVLGLTNHPHWHHPHGRTGLDSKIAIYPILEMETSLPADSGFSNSAHADLRSKF
eukprot:SAG11_NODE_7200_length_1178_cov_6.223355_1_plen_78_part_00